MHLRQILSILLIINAVSGRCQEITRAVATTRYEHPSLTERVFIGSNFRDIWAMPITVKVFRVSTEKGGLTIKELGGGMQTKSLRMEDKSGQNWVLRSVDKNVDKAMDAEGIKSPFLRSIAQAMISGAHPYASVTIAPMAKALGFVNTEPEVFYVPDDPALGEYRKTFANTICLLEKREPVLYAGDKTADTKKMLKDLSGNKNYRLDQKMLLQARLLDMLIVDWDRHGDQWKWEYHKDGEVTTIYPIPRDHDQAFFTSTGLLIKMVRPFKMKEIVGLTKKSRRIAKLSRKAVDFDDVLLKDLTEADWREGIQTFQAKLTDAVIMEGVKRLPPEVYKAQGEDLYNTLRSRRDSMPKAAMAYYEFLQKHEADPERVASWRKVKKG